MIKLNRKTYIITRTCTSTCNGGLDNKSLKKVKGQVIIFSI